ncbi:antitoxin VapB29 [soil metagenome]
MAPRCSLTPVRTTIDLPDDLHGLAVSIARDRGQSLSTTVALLIRRGLRPEARSGGDAVLMVDGFPLIALGRPTTSKDIRKLDDEMLE